jgi:hypothetical protein
MKTLKSMMTGIALLFIFGAANAAVKPANDKPTKTDVVNIYINAIAHGKINNLSGILDEDLQYNIQRGDNVNTLNRDQLLDNLKQSVNADATVTTTTTVLSGDDNSSVVKIEFKFENYTRTDIVSLSKTNGWQITSINTSTK